MGTRAHPANHRSQPPRDGQKNGHQQNHADESAPRAQIGIQSPGDQRPQRAAAPAQPVAFADGVRPAQGNLPALHGAPDGFMHKKQLHRRQNAEKQQQIRHGPPGGNLLSRRGPGAENTEIRRGQGRNYKQIPKQPLQHPAKCGKHSLRRGKGHHINHQKRQSPQQNRADQRPGEFPRFHLRHRAFFSNSRHPNLQNQLFLHLILYFHFLPDSIAGARRNWALI